MPPARRRFAPWLASALAVAAVIPGSAAAADVWGASVNDKVFPHSVRPADAAAEVALAAARDEYEGAFAAVRADATVTVEPKISDLTGPGVIPASSVELFRVGYVQLKSRSTGVDRHEGDGRYPDPLHPITGPITLPGGETTSIYVLVHVPGGAAPRGRGA